MKRLLLVLSATAAFWGYPVAAQTIEGVQPAALDQPRINAAISLGPLNSGTLLTANFGEGFDTFNIQAFFDTGASGVLLSNNTADFLNVLRATHNGQPIIFSDVGVAGSDNFNVSQEVHISLAPFTPETDVDNLDTYQTIYNQTFGPIRAQIGPVGTDPDPVLGDLDVFGVPLMKNKVVVMDPKPVNSFVDTIRTEVFNPGNAAIPVTSRHVLMTRSNFSPYTQVSPAGAPGPTLDGNPFIGPDPTGASSGSAPAVEMSMGSFSTAGSFLFDTGAAASMISSEIAQNLNVRYREGTEGTEAPLLEFVSDSSLVPDQFTLSIGGIGGTKKVVGFYMDSLMLPTVEGQSNAANNITFSGAPVLVNDISLLDPNTNQPLTLDGIFGMNFLVASAFVVEAQPFPIIGALTPGVFDWITYEHNYDATHAMLGLEVNPNPPLPGQYLWLGDSDFDTTANWNLTSPNWIDVDTFQFQIPYQAGRPVTFTDGIFATTVVITSPVSPVSVLINNSTSYNYTFSGAAITGSGGVSKQGLGAATFLNSNTYTGTTDVQGGTLVFSAAQNIGPVIVRSAGNLLMQSSQHFDGLRLLDGRATLTPGGNKFIRINQLEISGVSTNRGLDIGDGDLIINNKELTVPADVRSYLLGGRANGAWNGNGLRSSVAAGSPNLYSIGYADNALLGRTTFHGEAIGPDALIVQFTYAGDANLDGLVNVLDLYQLALSWQQTDRYWLNGDFNYDGLVNKQDLGILAKNWQVGVNNPLPGQSIYEQASILGLPESAVPEPSSAALATLGLVPLTRRARRRALRI